MTQSSFDHAAPRVLIPVDMALLPPLPPDAVWHQLGGDTMGTTWQVRALAPRSVTGDAIRVAVSACLVRVIAEMSTWEVDSDLSCFNRAAAGTWHALDEGFFTVLDAALTMAVDSGGAFDPTVGPLVNLWGFGPHGGGTALPDPAAFDRARARCGWQRLRLDRAQRRAWQPGGVSLDLSGIAKGYAVDGVAQALHALGCASWLVEIGGELRGQGVKPDGQPWWVALERPPQDTHAAMRLALHGLAVATSGDYRRSIARDGCLDSHTIDPRTGAPLRHALASVTVLHPQCMVADALATVLMVLGEDEGMAFAGARGIAALFIARRGHGFIERMTPAFAAMLA